MLGTCSMLPAALVRVQGLRNSKVEKNMCLILAQPSTLLQELGP
jgi:hypothetical protein